MAVAERGSNCDGSRGRETRSAALKQIRKRFPEEAPSEREKRFARGRRCDASLLQNLHRKEILITWGTAPANGQPTTSQGEGRSWQR